MIIHIVNDDYIDTDNAIGYHDGDNNGGGIYRGHGYGAHNGNGGLGRQYGLGGDHDNGLRDGGSVGGRGFGSGGHGNDSSIDAAGAPT